MQRKEGARLKRDNRRNEKVRENDERLEVDIEERRGKRVVFIVRVSRVGDRFTIYLPKTFNPTWEELWRSKKRVKIAVEA